MDIIVPSGYQLAAISSLRASRYQCLRTGIGMVWYGMGRNELVTICYYCAVIAMLDAIAFVVVVV
jgi:hypothetical protein